MIVHSSCVNSFLISHLTISHRLQNVFFSPALRNGCKIKVVVVVVIIKYTN